MCQPQDMVRVVTATAIARTTVVIRALVADADLPRDLQHPCYEGVESAAAMAEEIKRVTGQRDCCD